MDVRIKTVVEFTISGSSLEDALAEYDEITVTGLLKEILDKAIACDDIRIELVEGPNTLTVIAIDPMGNIEVNRVIHAGRPNVADASP